MHESQRHRTRYGAVLLCLALGACAVPPPITQRVVAHPATSDAAGTLLVTDVCLNYSPLGSDDYFVVGKALEGAKALEANALRFLDATDVRIRTKLTPFVCGALHEPQNNAKRVATNIDEEVSLRRQPLWVAPEVAPDSEYVSALQTIATFVFLESMAAYSAGTSAWSFDPKSIRQAAAVVANRSGRSSLLYIGVTGHSLSAGKAVTLGVARAAIGMAMAYAAGPIYQDSTTKIYVVFLPGVPADGRQVVAGLIDLKKGELLSSRIIRGAGDPMKPEILASPDSLSFLLRDLVFVGVGK